MMDEWTVCRVTGPALTALRRGRAMMEIVLIVAVADNGVIGADGAIPWRLKADMQRFKAMTMGKPVVMGRKTFVSLRRPLPGRTNIVVTRDRGLSRAPARRGDDVVRGRARGRARRRAAAFASAEIAVIGGAEIYAQWMEVADRLEITEVHARPEGDTLFPRSMRRSGRRSRACGIRPARTTARTFPM